jgi:hypothetical protein
MENTYENIDFKQFQWSEGKCFPNNTISHVLKSTDENTRLDFYIPNGNKMTIFKGLVTCAINDNFLSKLYDKDLISKIRIRFSSDMKFYDNKSMELNNELPNMKDVSCKIFIKSLFKEIIRDIPILIVLIQVVQFDMDIPIEKTYPTTTISPTPSKLVWYDQQCKCGVPGYTIECGKMRCDKHDDCSCFICSH